MSCKADLLQAIRSYRAEAGHIGSAKELLEQLSAVEKDVERLPDPTPRGSGDVPPERGGTRPDDHAGAGAHHPELHVEIHLGSPALRAEATKRFGKTRPDGRSPYAKRKARSGK